MNMHDVFVKPVVTEQTLKQTTDRNAYTFIVEKQATKHDIKKAFETIFDVTVMRVHTIVMKGGKKRVTGKQVSYAKKSDWKKAFITVKAGDTVDLFDVGGDKKDEKKKKKETKKK